MKKVALLLLLFLSPTLCLAGTSDNWFAGLGISKGDTLYNGGAIILGYRPTARTGYNYEYTVGGLVGVGNRNVGWISYSRTMEDDRLFAGFGLAVLNRTTPNLSTPIEFITTFGYHEDDKWDFCFRHISNGGIKKPNVGEDLFFLTWRF